VFVDDLLVYLTLIHYYPTRRSSDLTIEIGVAFTYKLFCRQYGCVGSRQRKIQEKRSIGFSLIADIICGLLSQMGQHLNVFKIRRSEEHTSELQSRENLVCRLLLEKK